MKDRRKGRPDSRSKTLEQVERRMTPDRRRNTRVPVQLWVEESKDEDLYFQITGNLSVGGLQFSKTIPHPLGTKVKLKFQLPGVEGVVETTGEVVCGSGRPDGVGAGIKFIDLDPVEKELIEKFIHQQLKSTPE